ncbi:putative RNA polymerase I-specific transcription initiation factor RRN3 [Lyophyllum shimeji]|uniref:RNA polymerase I-specific transcription initiation factor RRN3 n=1 Tax=Lyophyllum shimeji TaxID=47721 RepID=A0A9P3PEG1_LYOSH|nr:putative RNA polymerase I-specific transcription initiation factor RRN3 [Lyophyllum shimeji]
MAHPKSPVDAKRPMGTKKPDPQASSLLVRRPIATNSRVKQDEKYKKDMYLAFVHNALQQKTNGNSESFDELVDQFNLKCVTTDGVPRLAQLRLWLLALSHVVSRLERTHSALVHAIVNMPWTTLDSATVKSYTVFIGMLISARPEYLSLVLGKIAQGFTHQSGLQALDAGMPEGSSSPLTRRVIYDRLHYLLRHLLSLIPTLPSTLQPLLGRNFPHKRQNQIAQTTYIRNLLRVSVYCPELADKILATIIDRAIQIDVEIQVELEELEEADEAGQEDVFELDPFDTLVGQEGDDSDSEDGSGDEDDGDLSDISSDAGDMDDEAGTPEIPTNLTYIQEMVKKLDAILTLIFDHFHRNHTSITTTGALQAPPPLPELPPIDGLPSSPIHTPSASTTSFELQAPSSPSPPTPPPQDAQSSGTTERRKSLLRTQFHTLLSIFDRTILRTFKSRYTQFLLFWYTSLDPEFADIFQGMLVERALFGSSSAADGPAITSTTPAVTRAAAASYIGSFVSRATFVDREGTRQVVGVLCGFLKAHLDGVEELAREGALALGSAGMAQHSVFYAVAQAVFLIFCFRWRDLLEDEVGDGEDEFLIGSAEKSGKKWIPQLGVLQRVVTSVLNPLRVCSANVVTQFARVAHATDFLYCYTILESNKRSEYASNPSAASSSEQHRAPRSSIHPLILGAAANPELNTFFPFDPYRLPKSNAYIQGIYREWSTVAIDDDEEEEDEEDEEETEDAGELGSSGFLSIPRSDAPGADELGLGESLGKMSISPARLQMQASVGVSMV